uniref:Putative ovule protein n=1 Tax=Solanum chacoense TaxID=4108 RepID=A0A0V0HG61_SOLCH
MIWDALKGKYQCYCERFSHMLLCRFRDHNVSPLFAFDNSDYHQFKATSLLTLSNYKSQQTEEFSRY